MKSKEWKQYELMVGLSAGISVWLLMVQFVLIVVGKQISN